MIFPEVKEGERIHQCNICDNSFSQRKHIKSVHEWERLYQCNICDNSFSQRKHIKSLHEGEMVHQCKVCYKKIKNSGTGCGKWQHRGIDTKSIVPSPLRNWSYAEKHQKIKHFLSPWSVIMRSDFLWSSSYLPYNALERIKAKNEFW